MRSPAFLMWSGDAKFFQLASIARAKQVVSEAVQTRAEELERFGLKTLDALHIACAEAGGVAALLTTDDRMLAKARELRGSLYVKVENPILWLTEVVRNGAIENDTDTD